MRDDGPGWLCDIREDIGEHIRGESGAIVTQVVSRDDEPVVVAGSADIPD